MKSCSKIAFFIIATLVVMATTLFNCRMKNASVCAPMEKPIDSGVYKTQIAQLNYSIDSIGITNDTILTVALEKLNYIRNKYEALDNVEVQQKLAVLDWQAFVNVPLRFPDGYRNCYANEQLPVAYRKSCLNGLIEQYRDRLDFRKVLKVAEEYPRYFGDLDKYRDFTYISRIDSVRKCIHTIDSLDQTSLSTDSLFYFKAQAFGPICRTDWYCSQGCGGCSYSLVNDALKHFIRTFPMSKLADNVEFSLTDFEFLYSEDENESLKKLQAYYNKFKQKYPDSDVLADIWYFALFQYRDMYPMGSTAYKTACRKFLQDSPKDERAKEIREELEMQERY